MEVKTETRVECDDCRDEATIALCQRHYEDQLREEYDKGYKEGTESLV